MNLYHLRYFVTLAHLEHYTKAADVLAITQPSLSHAISSLETELGIKLFKKNGRNVALTSFGRSFLADAEEVLNRLDTSVGSLQLAGKGEGRIDLAFLRTLGTDFVPKIIRKFLDANEDKKIDFNLHCDKVITEEILTGLKEQKYDIGFCSKISNEPLIEFTPVAKQDLVVIVPTDHPLASRTEVHLKDTLEYKQIIYKKGSGLRHIVDELFKSIGATPDVAYEIAEDQVAAGFVANGFGICIAPDLPIMHSLDLKILPLVSPSWQRNFLYGSSEGCLPSACGGSLPPVCPVIPVPAGLGLPDKLTVFRLGPQALASLILHPAEPFHENVCIQCLLVPLSCR